MLRYILFIPLLLSACAQLTGINSAESKIDRGWSGVLEEDMTNQKPLYCYKTLAKPDCYDHPIKGREDQQVTQYPAPLKNRRHKGLLDFHDDEAFNEAVRKQYHPDPIATDKPNNKVCEGPLS